MPPSTRRERSSTAARGSPTMTASIAELQPLIDSLQVETQRQATSETFRSRSEELHRIRQFLLESNYPDQSKDAFRQLHGFQALLNTLRLASGFYQPSQLSHDDRIYFFEFLRATLGVLSEAMHQHWGNRRYFTKRVDGGGWAALEQAIASTNIASAGSDVWGECQLFGCLLAFALGDETLTQLFEGVRRHVNLLTHS